MFIEKNDLINLIAEPYLVAFATGDYFFLIFNVLLYNSLVTLVSFGHLIFFNKTFLVRTIKCSLLPNSHHWLTKYNYITLVLALYSIKYCKKTNERTRCRQANNAQNWNFRTRIRYIILYYSAVCEPL